jgi:methionyl aminopeptidase
MIRIKSEKDISGIRDSSRILVETLNDLERMIEPGITTLELDRFARAHRREGSSSGFSKLHGFSRLAVYIGESCRNSWDPR